MRKQQEAALFDVMRRMLHEMTVELACWRRRYPDAKSFIAEEAAAEIEGREPDYGPPIVRVAAGRAALKGGGE